MSSSSSNSHAPSLVPAHVERLTAYLPGGSSASLRRDRGIEIEEPVKLSSNESAFGPSPTVTEAVVRASQHLHRYPDPQSYELRDRLAKHHGVAVESVCVGNGSNELIDLLCRTFLGPEDHVVFPDPSFVCYRVGCQLAQVDHTVVPLPDPFALDSDALLAAVRPQTKLLFVANPNNPTGTYLPRREVERLLAELPPRVLLVMDEAYVEFADAADYESALTLDRQNPRLIVLRTFSKAYGLAALRVGYAIAPPACVEYLNRVRAPFNVNGLAQAAARAALADSEHLQHAVAVTQRERARLSRELDRLGYRIVPSQANFLLVQNRGPSLYDQLLERGLIVRPLGEPIRDWVRITVGRPDQNTRLLEALAQLPEA